MPRRSATRRVTASDMWVLRLSQTNSHRAVGDAEANRLSRNATKSASMRVSPILPRILPVRRFASLAGANETLTWRHRTRRSALPYHAGCTRTRAARRVPASSAGSGRHLPAPGCRSSHRSGRSARACRWRPARRRRTAAGRIAQACRHPGGCRRILPPAAPVTCRLAPNPRLAGRLADPKAGGGRQNDPGRFRQLPRR